MDEGVHLYIMYDIEDNAIRGRLAARLMFYGMRRIQYSVFEGVVSPREKLTIVEEIDGLALGDNDKVHIVELCARCVKKKMQSWEVEL